MNESKIPVRYAKSLYSSAKQKNILIEIKKDIEYLQEVVKKVDEFYILTESPVIKLSEKKNIFHGLFRNNLNDLTISFLDIILENRRELFISDICRDFIDLYKKDQGIKAVVIKTAHKLDSESLEKIKIFLQKKFNATIEITESIDKSLIGGFVITIDDLQIDASVTNQLLKIKRELFTTTVKN